MLPNVRMPRVYTLAVAVLVIVASGAAANVPQVVVTRSDASGFGAAVSAPDFSSTAVTIAGGDFLKLEWADASVTGEIGTPAVPVVRRLFVAPTGATVTVNVTLGSATTTDLDAAGLPWRILPVQPPIEKLPGARERAAFQYNAAAYQAAPAATPRATVEELGIARGQRIFLLEVRPIEYNPVAHTVTLWSELNVDVQFTGGQAPASNLSPLPGLRQIVLNPDQLPSSGLRGTGNYLIIVASAYQSTIASFAAAKQAQGFTVSTWVPTSASNTVIKTYIQSLWGTGNAPDYILLVGDTDTIPHWVGGGEGTPSTDLQYGCMDGTSDWYPDIAIGRFPVRTTAQLTAIINKTLAYENGPLTDPGYLKRAVFMASEDNYTVSEGTHNWVITNYMIPNGITYDRLYSHTYSATTQQVSAAFNAGRFWGIYSGHGGNDYWADGPVFHQADVNALTNLGMYPVVYSFACVTGTYTDDECFMETWIRAANKAAIIAVGSSVNSYWTEDDVLERRLFDSIFDKEDAVPAEVGPVLNDAKMRFLSEMGTGATTRRYFEMYNIMGDPALRYPGSCSDAGTAALDRTMYGCQSAANITVVDCGLNTSDTVIDTVTVTLSSTREPAGEPVELTETSPDSAEFTGGIVLSTTNSPGVLWVAAGNTVTLTYVDADNGSGGTSVPVVVTAGVDCTPPQISNVRMSDTQARSAVVTFDSNEAVKGAVHYGLSCGDVSLTANGSGYSLAPTVGISGLTDNTTYFYTVEAEDEAGNVAASDNGGACYTFTTPEVPDFFTELFSGANDLDNFTLTFTPNGSNDFYAGCAESISSLPTDPTGGTALSFSPSADDGYATVTLSGAALVSLYGTTYSTFYPVTNGYLCFVHGETGYNETYADHFGGVPKISALFDDLNPGSGGSVTWKQLADRAAVTWLNVPEYNQSTTNTFQIEMFFDGKITISYLALAATDGLAGLSKGTGLDPDFLPTDLTTMGACGPQPPQAQNGSAGTAVATPVTVTLHGTDDGLPNPPGALSFGIASLPAHGSLTDPGAGVIGSVPTALTGNQVVYTPAPGYAGADSFTFTANDGGTPPEGGDSAPATVSLNVGGAAWNPVAYNGSASTAISLAVEVTLSGSDPNGDPLTYEIVSLPASGYLSDPGAGAITAVPYTLVSGGRVVTYQPPCGQALSDSFTFRVHDATAGSNVATVAVTVNASGARRVYHFPLDTNPGWTTQGAWAFGPPTGGGTHHLDPSAGYTGTNVYGYNLAGDYTNNLTAKYLTTTALNCANLTNTQLRFRRWLGVEKTDRATVEVSNNGTTWTTLWQNPTTANVSDAAWSQQVFDLTAYADGQATVYVRWGMGPTDGGVTFPGWNVDDVEVWAEVPLIASDFNGDGLVTLGDFAILNECLAGPEGGLAPACLCVDLDADGDVDLADFAEFQSVVTE